MARVSQQRAALGPDFIQLSGEDATALGFMAHGGHGCISVTANVAPALCAEFQLACLAGNFQRGASAAGPADAAARCAVRRIQSRPGEICRLEARAVQRGDASSACADRRLIARSASTTPSPRSVSLSSRAAKATGHGAEARERQARRREPEGALQLRHRGEARGRHPAHRHRGEVAARRQGQHRRLLCGERRRRALSRQRPHPRICAGQPQQSRRPRGRASCCCTAKRSDGSWAPFSARA